MPDTRSFELNGYNFVTGSNEAVIRLLFDENLPLGLSRVVFTPNLSIWGAVEKDKNLNFIKSESEFHIADGWPIALALSIKYRQRISRCTGSDLLPALVRYCSTRNLQMAIVGGHEGYEGTLREVFAKMKINLEFRIFDLVVSLVDLKIDKHFLSQLKEFQPDVIVICLGFPKQELFGLELRKEFAVPILCLGAALDFMVFPKLRAPQLFIFLKLEWFWRFLHEPKRLFKRYYLDALGGLPSLIRSIL